MTAISNQIHKLLLGKCPDEVVHAAVALVYRLEQEKCAAVALVHGLEQEKTEVEATLTAVRKGRDLVLLQRQDGS